jgi:phospholipase C
MGETEAAGLVGAIAGPGDQIKHVIVLMLENRSFDHLLGYLKHENPSYPSLARLRVSCPKDPEEPDGERIPTTDDAARVLGTDPDHSYEAAKLQIFGCCEPQPAALPRMNGFVESYAIKISDGSLQPRNAFVRMFGAVKDALARWWDWLRCRPKPVAPIAADIMKCHSEDAAPVLSTLAKEYAVFVNWHASVPGETWPNRNFVHAATSDGEANICPRYFYNRTIFELLEAAGREWRVYHDGIAQVWAFPKLWRGGTQGFSDINELYVDIKRNALPAYAFVEPNHGIGRGEGNSQHPGNNLVGGASFVGGEALIATIYNALVKSPEVFAKTLFLIVYDEHGGFYDHVAPKKVPPPDDKVGKTGFEFDISGIRVPAVAVSPLITKGTMDDNFYDHASIPKLVRECFAPTSAPLTNRDREAANPLAHLSLRATPRTDCVTIDVPALKRTGVARAAKSQTLTELQASLVKLAGAVKTTVERDRIGAETFSVTPDFDPEPSVVAEADSRLLLPNSDASRAVDEAIAYFADPPPDGIADIELGPR